MVRVTQQRDRDLSGDFTQLCDVTLCVWRVQGGDNEDKDDIVENVEHQTSEDVTHWDNVIETHEHIPNIDIFSPYEVMSPAPEQIIMGR